MLLVTYSAADDGFAFRGWDDLRKKQRWSIPPTPLCRSVNRVRTGCNREISVYPYQEFHLIGYQLGLRILFDDYRFIDFGCNSPIANMLIIGVNDPSTVDMSE